MANSKEKNFPECNIIMCYFHLKVKNRSQFTNIRSQKSRLPKLEYSSILAEITKLHLCLNQKYYNVLFEKILKRWESQSNLVDFRKYFIKQWIKSDYLVIPIFLKF